MKRINVAVLMGGKTPEHEISLISGREVVRRLNKKKYKAIPIVISRNGETWQLVSSTKLLNLPNPLLLKDTGKELIKTGGKRIGGVQQIGRYVDVVFIAMHGPFGEDGTVQGLLEMVGVTYTGPGVLASALGMDKLAFRKILSYENIKFPKFVSVRRGEKPNKIRKNLGDPPYFVKPNNQGSSVGNSLIKRTSDLQRGLNLAYEYSDLALVDEYIKGIEVTCGVIGNDEPVALPLVEIIPLKSEYFDYESKYTESGAKEIVPARIPKNLTKKIQDIAIDVYQCLGCKGFSRVDFKVRRNTPYVLEINTIPGLTPMSLLPKAALAHGLDYSQFLDRIIRYALETP